MPEGQGDKIMKNSITNQLRELGLSERQIKRFNNLCNYRGMSFKRATKVFYDRPQYNKAVIRILDEELGDILEFDTTFVFAR